MNNWAWNKFYKNGWPVILAIIIISLLLSLVEIVFNITIFKP